jgi:hypothetical protein
VELAESLLATPVVGNDRLQGDLLENDPDREHQRSIRTPPRCNQLILAKAAMPVDPKAQAPCRFTACRRRCLIQ